MSSISDCLVFKIEEFADNVLDTTLFILYDTTEETFLIRGKRSNYLKIQPESYCFQCANINQVNDFISLVVCRDSELSYTLYNYPDLPLHPDEIDYYYLKEYDHDKAYEITGFDKQKYGKSSMKRILKLLKGVFNPY